MSSTLIAVLLLALFIQANGDSYEAEKQKLRQQAMKTLAECKVKVGASTQDLQAIANKQIPTSRTGMCMLECAFTSVNMMKNGKLDVDSTLKLLSPALSKNADKSKKITQSLRTCEKEIGKGGADGCETAKLIAQCFQREVKTSA